MKTKGSNGEGHTNCIVNVALGAMPPLPEGGQPQMRHECRRRIRRCTNAGANMAQNENAKGLISQIKPAIS